VEKDRKSEVRGYLDTQLLLYALDVLTALLQPDQLTDFIELPLVSGLQ